MTVDNVMLRTRTIEYAWGKKNPSKIVLSCTLFSPDDLVFDREIDLMHISQSERSLNKKRFKNFYGKRWWSNTITFFPSEPIALEGFHHFGSVWVEDLVTWISENIDSPWCFTVRRNPTRKYAYIFSFEDEAAAMYFALRWK